MSVSLFIGSLNLRTFAQLVVNAFVSETVLILLIVIKNLSKKVLRNDSSLFSANVLYRKHHINDALAPPVTIFH